MDEKQKKEYVKNSLRFDSGKRVTEVMLRYFALRNSAEKIKKSGIIGTAEKLFS